MNLSPLFYDVITALVRYAKLRFAFRCEVNDNPFLSRM